ncbi:MAG: virulence protein RhuM/Fic/DOC family protein [Bacteroidetes bacterium]|nr:virulence protein RhuM/Fic/DOC family protein [Bacteroidota bacterium]
MNEIIIYQTKDKKTEIEVKFEDETVWLSQAQMTLLFNRERSVITKHINNVFEEGELSKKGNVQKMHIPKSDKPITLFSLDVIISVGYRVKSRQGTQFRIWATQHLKSYLLKGFAINEKRLAQLQQTIELISKGGKAMDLHLNEAQGLLDIIGNYSNSFVLLNQFDGNKIAKGKLDDRITYEIEYSEAKKAIDELKKQLIRKKEATALFGNEKDGGFKSSLQTIVQTFGEQYLYPSIEEQAANLLYFVIKNHSFSDGNKRIGAFLFIWFLEKNKHRFKRNGEVKINDNGLTALALLVAQSDQKEKDLMIDLIVNLIADHNK